MHEGNPQIINAKGHVNISYSITKCKCQSEHRNKIKPSTLCPLYFPAHARRQIRDSQALIYNSDRFLWSRVSCLNLCHVWNLCHLPVNRRSSSNKHLKQIYLVSDVSVHGYRAVYLDKWWYFELWWEHMGKAEKEQKNKRTEVFKIISKGVLPVR